MSRQLMLWSLFPQDLEHPVRVGRFLQDVLMNVPMLDDLAILEPENINYSNAARATHSDSVHVQDYVIAISEHPFYLAVCIRKFVAKVPDKAFQPLMPVSGILIMLNIHRTEVFRGSFKILLIDRSVVKLHHDLLVVFLSFCISPVDSIGHER